MLISNFPELSEALIHFWIICPQCKGRKLGKRVCPLNDLDLVAKQAQLDSAAFCSKSCENLYSDENDHPIDRYDNRDEPFDAWMDEEVDDGK